MQAAVLHEFGPTLSVEDVPRPVPGPDAVKATLDPAGICNPGVLVP